MPKIKYKQYKEFDGELDTRRFYENKYFGLFLNAYRFPNLSKNQNRFLFKKFWQNGTIAAFVLDGTKQEPTLKELLTNSNKSTVALANDDTNGLLIFVPYAPVQYNIEDEPSVVNYVNLRGATFIPNGIFKVNKDCVIGWAHSSHAPIKNLVMYYINKIVEVENTISTNLFVHKLPRLIVVTPEDRQRVEDLLQDIERGEKKIFLESDDIDAIKNVLEAGGNTSYIIDKLYAYKQCLENELLTFFGFNNISIEKKERLITDEANANNQLISDSSDCFVDCLKDFGEEVKNILGIDLGELEIKQAPILEEVPQMEEGEEDNVD